MSTSRSAFGTLIKIGDGASSETFATIDGVTNIQGPGFSLETQDVTHHTSAGNYREVIPTFLSGGEISFDLFFDPDDTEHEALLTDYEGRTLRNFQIVYPGATSNKTYTMAAYITKIDPQAPVDNALTMAVTLTVSGAVTRS